MTFFLFLGQRANYHGQKHRGGEGLAGGICNTLVEVSRVFVFALGSDKTTLALLLRLAPPVVLGSWWRPVLRRAVLSDCARSRLSLVETGIIFRLVC